MISITGPEATGAESDLVRLARQGDGFAWEMLVGEHQAPVFRLAYLLLGEPDDAQDVAQETFIRAYHALHRFDSERPLRPWLLRIAANLAHNRKRSLRRYLAALKRLAQERPSQVIFHPQTADLQPLGEAVGRLKWQHRETIYLRYFLEMSEVEMADVLGVAPGTVKSRLHRALDSLRKLIEQDYPYLKDELYG